MNLLAHALLAADPPEYLLGNLVADFLRPMDLDSLPDGIRAGVMTHRQVDAFTDRHPVVQRSIARISEKWGWFSGILIDVYYDHILATDWSRYSTEPLRGFVDHVHAVIGEYDVYLPDETRRVIRTFVETDRLMSYGIPDGSGIEEALRRLSVRIAERLPKRAMPLAEAMPQLRVAHADLAADFHAFFPELQRFAAERSPWPT